jgi:hypothetical protein
MPNPVPKHLDAFHKLVGVGDEVATITYSENEPYRGIVTKLGKNQMKVRENYHNSGEERWVATWRSIKLRSKEEIELDQD